MGELGIKRNKSRLLTVLFAFTLPGAGHLYTGQHPRGLLLIATFLLDLTAIIRLAESDGGRHLLLIVYLGILLPVFYFISVFDSLQSMEAAEEQGVITFRLTQGILLLVSGCFMLIMVKPPKALLPWMNELAELSVGPIIIVAAALLLLNSKKGSVSMFKLGRFTAATLVLAVGALLLWDQIQGRNDISLLGEWWPVFFILLGFEIIAFNLKFKRNPQKLRLDLLGGMISIVISATAYVVTQYADLPFRWLDQFNVDLNGTSVYGEEKGFRYDKPVIKVPLDEELSLIQIVNPNGQVTVRSGDVQEVEVLTTVWVDLVEEAEAITVAEQSMVKITPGQKLTLEAKGQAYGANGGRKPSLNIIVTVPMSLSDQFTIEELPEVTPTITPDSTPDPTTDPAQSEVIQESETAAPLETEEPDMTFELIEVIEDQKPAVKLQVEAENGSVAINGLSLPGGLEIQSNSGLVEVSNIMGPVFVKGNHVEIQVNHVTGDSSLETKHGAITASHIQGKLYANALNGNLKIEHILDDIEAETKNGKIEMIEVGASVKANTLNGSIELNSGTVGGDWDLDSSIGEIILSVPMYGHFTVFGSVTFGNISTELPLDVSKKTLRGTVGEGTHRIQINATNSITIKRFGPFM